jgi:phasin
MIDIPQGIPSQIIDLAEKNVEQARGAFLGFIGAAQKATDAAETLPSSAKDAMAKAMSFAENNVNAAFDLAQKLVRAKDVSEVLALQSEFAKAQMAAMQTQVKELGWPLVSEPQSSVDVCYGPVTDELANPDSIEILTLAEPMPKSIAPETEKLEDLAELAFPVTKEEKSKASSRPKKTTRKAVAKKAAARKMVTAKKAAPKKAATRKAVAKKAAPGKMVTAKKAAPKKAAARKAAPRKRP